MVKKPVASSSNDSKRQRVESNTESEKYTYILYICIYNRCSESIIDDKIHWKNKVLFLFSSVLIFAHIICASCCSVLLLQSGAVLLSLVCKYSVYNFFWTTQRATLIQCLCFDWNAIFTSYCETNHSTNQNRYRKTDSCLCSFCLLSKFFLSIEKRRQKKS